MDGASGDEAEIEVVYGPCGAGDVVDLAQKALVDVHLTDIPLHLCDYVLLEHRPNTNFWRGLHPEDLDLLFIAQIIHGALDHESVDLSFGERVDALGLDWVQGGDHHERLRKREGRALDGDLSLLHGLAKGRRGLRG